jgi:predicted membrane channel-forming protein YqfA (hemolysin III family)
MLNSPDIHKRTYKKLAYLNIPNIIRGTVTPIMIYKEWDFCFSMCIVAEI